MYRLFNGYSLSQAQLEAKAEAAAHVGQLDGDSNQGRAGHSGAPRPSEACDWQGDSPEPELDDLAYQHKHQPSRPEDACDWRGDSPEPELDDLAYQHSHQSSRPEDACDWRGDPPTQYEDEFQSTCPPKGQNKKSAHNKESEETASKSPVSLPHIGLPWTADKASKSSGSLVEDGRRSGPSKKSQPKSNDAGAAGGSAKSRSTEPRIVVDHPSDEGDARHSPWVDSLEERSEAMYERLNKGYQQTVSAIGRILTPPAQGKSDEQPHSPQSAPAGEPRRGSALAPESAALPPSDFYVPRPTGTSPGHSTDEDNPKARKAKEREKRRAEKKARREARRQEKKDKQRKRREKKRQQRERRRKEKEWKKAEKEGGDLHPAIAQGLRVSPDTKIPYNPRCEICSKSAVAAISSSKWNPKCTLCGKGAQREATQNYLKSAKIQMDIVDNLEDLHDVIGKSFGGKKTAEGNVNALQEEIQLAKHMALHVRDYASNGGAAALKGHTCNDNGQPGHLARQGLDGNRDSPPMVDGNEVTQCPSSKALGLPRASTTSEVDWWVRAVASSDSSVTTHRRPGSPRPAPVTPLRRSKSTVYEPRQLRASLANRLDISPSIYHFYLPFAVCHSFPCTPRQPSLSHGWPTPPFPHGSTPARPHAHLFGSDLNRLTPGRAETIPSDTPRQSQDGFFIRRNESV